eukprot:2275425-Rhodomonas_salina.3
MSLQQPLPRRTVLSASMRNAFCVFPGLVNLFQGNAANAADSQQPPVGHRSEMVQVGQKKVPLELWFPLQKEWQSTDGAKSRIAEYPYSVSITKLFRLLAKRNLSLRHDAYLREARRRRFPRSSPGICRCAILVPDFAQREVVEEPHATQHKQNCADASSGRFSALPS